MLGAFLQYGISQEGKSLSEMGSWFGTLWCYAWLAGLTRVYMGH
jgi:hypothetical protein